MPLKLRIFRIACSTWRARPARVRAVFTASAPPRVGTAGSKALRGWWVWRRFVGRVARRVTPKQRMQCFHSQGGCCNFCKMPLAKGFHVDHIIPKYAGGGNEQANLQALYAECHRKKTQAQNPYKVIRDLIENGFPDAGKPMPSFPPTAAAPREIISSEKQLAELGSAASFVMKKEQQLPSPSRAVIGLMIAVLKVVN